MKLLSFLSAACISLSAVQVHSEIFTWKDAKGNAHYVNNIYDVPERYRAKVKTVNLGIPEKSDSTPSPAAQPATQAPAALPPTEASQPSAPPVNAPAKAFQPVKAPPLPQSLLTSPVPNKQPGRKRRVSRSSTESDE